MGAFKLSLHKSGVWTFAATAQSGIVFADGNRRAKRWNRPLEHSPGVTRGPSIIVPRTSLGSRPLTADETRKAVKWSPAPRIGEVIEFSLYLVASGASTRWPRHEVVVGELDLARGNRVVLLSAPRRPPPGLLDTVEKLLRDNVFRMKDPSRFAGGPLLWVSQSEDALHVPMIFDLPVPIGPENALDGAHPAGA